MHVTFDREEFRPIVRELLNEILVVMGWPVGRIALDEAEAANACGVQRHVLRDLRLTGKIQGRRLGRKIVYLPSDLIAGLDSLPRSGNPPLANTANVLAARTDAETTRTYTTLPQP
ncbi:MAG: hypothetical protein ACKVP0_22600 [Pirellulaceae bacterium]